MNDLSKNELRVDQFDGLVHWVMKMGMNINESSLLRLGKRKTWVERKNDLSNRVRNFRNISQTWARHWSNENLEKAREDAC